MDILILCDQFCFYSLSIRGYSKNTIRRYKYVLNGFVHFSGVSDLNQVTNEKVRALFFYGRTERKWSVNTFVVYHKTLKVFFRWCIKQGYLSSNPIDDIEVPRLEKKLPRKLNKQDALRLLEVVYNYPYQYKFIRYRNHAIFSTFIFAGLRKQELLNLKLADVDLENLSIFIQQGKGGKDRILPINHTLAQSLKRYVNERKRLGKTSPEFFTSLRFNRGFTMDSLKKVVLQMSRVSGIQFSVHRLRHTFATLMLEGGCDIYSLSKMMGHSDINTTTIYLSASVEHLRNQILKHPLNNKID